MRYSFNADDLKLSNFRRVFWCRKWFIFKSVSTDVRNSALCEQGSTETFHHILDNQSVLPPEQKGSFPLQSYQLSVTIVNFEVSKRNFEFSFCNILDFGSLNIFVSYISIVPIGICEPLPRLPTKSQLVFKLIKLLTTLSWLSIPEMSTFLEHSISKSCLW